MPKESEEAPLRASLLEDCAFVLRRCHGTPGKDVLSAILEDYLAVRYESADIRQRALRLLTEIFVWFFRNKWRLVEEGFVTDLSGDRMEVSFCIFHAIYDEISRSTSTGKATPIDIEAVIKAAHKPAQQAVRDNLGDAQGNRDA